MKDGNIMQVAEPLELYNTPANMFVAGFIGSPPMNFIHGVVEDKGGNLYFAENNESASRIRIRLSDDLGRRAAAFSGKEIVFGIRPEDVLQRPAEADSDHGQSTAVNVEVAEPMGNETFLYLSSGAHSFIARVKSDAKFETNQNVRIDFNLQKAHFFNPETENVIV